MGRGCLYLLVYPKYWLRHFTYSFSFNFQNALRKAVQSCGVRETEVRGVKKLSHSYRAGHGGAQIPAQVSVTPVWTELYIQKGVITSPGLKKKKRLYFVEQL